MSHFIEHQHWRYSTKKYDPSRMVSAEDFHTLKEAIRLSTSSYGLQPYKVLIIENKELREKLRAAGGGQSQITDASYLVVFANDIQLDAAKIDSYIQNVSLTREIPAENLSGYATFMKSKLLPLSDAEKSVWTSKQTYLALGNLMNAAAELKIDVTPMEGFEVDDFNKILGLNALGLNAALIAAIGYRHEKDAGQHHKKVRKSSEELFIHL